MQAVGLAMAWRQQALTAQSDRIDGIDILV
jgi:hypothetical protein